MLLKYGSYSFAAGSVEITTDIEPIWNDGGQLIAQRKRVNVSGYLDGDGPAAITSAMQQLEAALAVVHQDLIFYTDDAGTSESATLLRNAGSISGVQIDRGPGYPQGKGPIYATYNYFSFSAWAEYPFSSAGNALLSWTETVELWGGGPLRDVFPCLNALPQEQILWPATPFEAVQRGTIVGYLAYPPAPPCFAPAKMVNFPGRFSRRSPKRRGGGFTEFPVDYQYVMKSATPLVAVPLRWLS